ncbi:MAG TPA: NADPH:quinone oxidoreductase family protein [Alphaproteobacteria bacterium]|nr:NADPH:quinone oxidoreductase family protein [Alphaproteobacteria bacterium]
MKAVRVHELGNRSGVTVDDIPEPDAGPGEVVVDLAAATINYPDILMLDGKYQVRPDLPYVLGKDATGTVCAIGEGVSGFAVGDRVLFYVHYGAFAEKVAVPVTNCFKLPNDMPLDDAAAMGVAFQTVWAALVDRAALQPGEVVLVTGAAGGVGIAGVALAKALGAGTVLAGLTTMSKADAVKAAGADHIIDMSGDELKDGVRDQVRQATGGRDVDVVLDVVGGDIFDACLRTLAFNGRIVVLGFMGGRIADVKTNYLLLKNISVVGSSINAIYARDNKSVHHGQAEMVRLYREGKLAPHIHQRFPLDKIAEAIAVVEDRSIIGKVVLEI